MKASQLQNDKERNDLEIEKLRAEIIKIKNEQNWIDEKQKIEIEKLKVETEKIKNEKGWKRLLVPTFIQIIPGVTLAIITFLIAQRQNLFKQQEISNQIEKKSIDNARQALETKQDIFELEIQEKNIREKLNQFQKDSVQITISIDSINELYNSVSKEKGIISDELKVLVVEKDKLSLKLKLLPFTYYFSEIRKGDFFLQNTNKFIDDYNKERDYQVVEIITDSLEIIKKEIPLRPLITFLQYRIWNTDFYFNQLLSCIKEAFVYSKDFNDQYLRKGLSVNDSLENSKIYKYGGSLNFALTNDWDNTHKIKIVKEIVTNLRKKYVNNDLYNQLLNVPAILNNEMNFDLFNLNRQVYFDYLELNLLIVKNNKVSTIICYDNLDRIDINLGDTSKAGNVNYDFYRDENLRKNCLINLALYCPQIYVAFVAKGYDQFFKISSSDTSDIYSRPNGFIYPTFNNLVTKHEFGNMYPMTGRICDSIFNNISGLDSLDINTPNFKNKSISDVVPDLIPLYYNCYEKNKIEIERWLDPSMNYFKRNIGILKDKLLKREF